MQGLELGPEPSSGSLYLEAGWMASTLFYLLFVCDYVFIWGILEVGRLRRQFLDSSHNLVTTRLIQLLEFWLCMVAI